ncbi:MAG: hypothetical protein KIT72_08210 [Polyangiaceae bacterium]|nr:hypothetical protein [Polyangiaceae bacterium]MCW5790390.1 hypothetical protein [Polyangiaceae bacterium]
MPRLRSSWLLAAPLLMTLAAHPAEAQEGARAEALFREGRQLMEAEQYDEACPKFAASYKLDAAVGTLLNLADCHEKLGLTASAWSEFLQVATLSRRAGHQARAEVAEERAKDLEGRLIRLKLVVPEGVQVDGMEIRQDGVLIDAATWNVATPIDPGPHLLSVSAPGKKEWVKAFEAEGEQTTLTIDIPMLEDAPVEETPGPKIPTEPEPARPLPPPTNGQRTSGIIVTGAGVIGLGIGTLFGLSARSKWNDADCADNVCPTPERQTLAEDAKVHANLSTLFFFGGGVLSAAGIILLLTAPSDERPPTTGLKSLHLSPAVGPTTGMWLGGLF